MNKTKFRRHGKKLVRVGKKKFRGWERGGILFRGKRFSAGKNLGGKEARLKKRNEGGKKQQRVARQRLGGGDSGGGGGGSGGGGSGGGGGGGVGGGGSGGT